MSFVSLQRNQCKIDILSEESTQKPEPWQATAVSSLGCISRSIPPCAQTNVTLRRNSHYFRLICKNWPLTLITAPHCASLGHGWCRCMMESIAASYFVLIKYYCIHILVLNRIIKIEKLTKSTKRLGDFQLSKMT